MPTLDGPVLLTLAKLTGPVTGRQVHQLTGIGSEAGVRKVLTRLVRHGLVREYPAGGAYLCSINREHLAWPAVEELAGMRGQLLARLRQALDRLRADVRAWTGNSCQIYELGSDDLQRHIAAGDPMVAAWRTDAITVAGTDLRGLLRDLGHRASA